MNPIKGNLTELKKKRARLLRALVDEYGDLSKTVQPYKPDMSRLADVARELRQMHAGLDAAEPIVIEGDHYRVTLGACGMRTAIDDMQAVYDTLGHKSFIASVTITLKALEEAMAQRREPSVCLSSLTTKTQTGPRSISVVELSE